MNPTKSCLLLAVAAGALLLGVCSAFGWPGSQEADEPAPRSARKSEAMRVHYLEIVTPDVDATCEILAAAHGTTFGEPLPELGNARTAPLADGGLLGVRAPMHEMEEPATRPYLVVDDIEAAIEAAEKRGAQFAMKATEIPGKGKFAIYFLGGLQYGLWEVAKGG